jgi:hypothetical protein
MIKVTDQKTPTVESDSILVQEQYANIPTPSNQLSSGVYYSWKGKWLDMWDKFVTRAQALITANLANYVPKIRTITINGDTKDLSQNRSWGTYVEDEQKLYDLFKASGIIYGGELSINGGDNTKFDVTAGQGIIVDDWTDVDNPVTYNVEWDAYSAQTVTNIGTQTVTYVFVDNTGALYQSSSAPTPILRRDYIYLGQLAHTNLTTINTITNSPDTYISPISQFRDLEQAIGTINLGNTITPNGANLKLNKGAGSIYLNGVNFFTNAKNPSFKTFAAYTAFTFRYRTQTGNGANTSDIDPTKYDNAGTITAIGGTKSTNQRVYLTPAGNIVIQYGQTEYSSLSAAIEAIQTETFILYPNLSYHAVLIAIISVQSNCSSLQDTTRCKITIASKFGEAQGGSGGGSSGITDLNGLTATTQSFATGTTGTDFNISSATSTHTFNLPTASATNRGALSSTDWSTFNSKIGGSGTTNEIAYFTASGTIASLTTGTYPSLTELSYVKGVTSAIQTQLDNKPDILAIQVFM